jgi:hypothetical protein
MKAEDHVGPKARENFEKALMKIFQAPKKTGSKSVKATARKKARPGLERLLLPRPCRRMIERVCILARQFGVGRVLAGDLRHEIGEAVRVVQRIAAFL